VRNSSMVYLALCIIKVNVSRGRGVKKGEEKEEGMKRGKKERKMYHLLFCISIHSFFKNDTKGYVSIQNPTHTYTQMHKNQILFSLKVNPF
jgi:hypothetical protein